MSLLSCFLKQVKLKILEKAASARMRGLFFLRCVCSVRGCCSAPPQPLAGRLPLLEGLGGVSSAAGGLRAVGSGVKQTTGEEKTRVPRLGQGRGSSPWLPSVTASSPWVIFPS